MADITGMFGSPELIQQKRVQDITDRRAANSRLGGSYEGLLGQIAAGGGTTGATLAEGIGRVFGMKTPEEARAAQIQDMASNLNLETPQGLALFARMLNDQGMTEEAMKVFELAQAKKKSATDELLTAEKLREAQEGTFKPVPAGKKYNPATGEYETQYLLYNERTSEFRNLDGSPYTGNKPAAADEAPTMEGGGGASDYAREKGWTTK